MQNAIDAGYDGIVIGQRHQGSAELDGAFCGSGDVPADRRSCTSHTALHEIFGETATFERPYPAGHGPQPGDEGERVTAITFFDGWGYAHLIDAKTSEELDAFATPEAVDERYASGFGDLSIHEFATDPETNLAYASYYGAGIQVFRFSREQGLVQTGKLIDEGGSNFWGVEQFTNPKFGRLIAGSDRDFGLQILCYTGPASSEASKRPCNSAAPPANPTLLPAPAPAQAQAQAQVAAQQARHPTPTHPRLASSRNRKHGP